MQSVMDGAPSRTITCGFARVPRTIESKTVHFFARARALIVKLAYLGTLALKLPNGVAAWLSCRTRQRVGVLSEAQVTKESSCEPPPFGSSGRPFL
jgi:hypothetical protein